MEIIDIFVENTSGEGVYAIRWEKDGVDEFERNLDLWSDPSYVIDYLEKNKNYLETEFFKNESIDTLSKKVAREAVEIEDSMLRLAEAGFANSKEQLQVLFKPLKNNEYVLYVYQESKAVIADHRFPKPILRFYAIRISPNTYVITGGAIKLTKEMDEHDDTRQELIKLGSAKVFLVKQGLLTGEEIKTFIDEQP